MITVTKNNTETSRTKFTLRGEECYEHDTTKKERTKRKKKERTKRKEENWIFGIENI